MSTDPLIGQQLAHFRLEHLIGQGGMARVYYGRDLTLQRPVAIKVIDRQFSDEHSHYAQQLIAEARAIARWQHENIVQIYYADQQEYLSYFVMEFINGLDLGELLRQYAQADELPPYNDVLHIGKGIASALDYAHQRNVIHRDIKPGNVMISTDNRVMLMDFGIAMNVTQEQIGKVFGTPHYIAPEQARNPADAVPQSDLYSLGVLLYQMLTGSLPFDDPMPTAVALKHVMVEPPLPRTINPMLNRQTEVVLLKALSKDPADRYQSGAELMAALQEALHSISLSSLSKKRLPTALTAIMAPAASAVSVADKLRVHQQHLPTRLAHPEEVIEGQAVRSPAIPAALPVMVAKSREYLQSEKARPFLPVLVVLALIIPLALIGLLVMLISNDGDEADASVSSERLLEDGVSTLPATPDVRAVSANLSQPGTNALMLIYDNNALYIYNLSVDGIWLDPLAFERLDASGFATDRIEGGRFARYAPRHQVMSGWCVEIELRSAGSYSSPAQCQGINSHISIVRDDGEDFWTAKDGSSEFRVLWDGTEIARCAIEQGMCEVALP